MATSSSGSATPMYRSFSSESQKKDWNKRLSLRGSNRSKDEPSTLKRSKFSNRSASLKQSRPTPVSLELQSNATLVHITPAPPATPKKSNWEVIEHFNPSNGGRSSVSSSLIAAGITRCNLDESIESTQSPSTCNSPMIQQKDIQSTFLSCSETDNRYADGIPNAISPSISFWFRLNKVIIRMCSTHQFKNLQVEILYQRYFLRMNQSNTTHILGLLLILVLALSTVYLAFSTFTIRPSKFPNNETTENSQLIPMGNTSSFLEYSNLSTTYDWNAILKLMEERPRINTGSILNNLNSRSNGTPPLRTPYHRQKRKLYQFKKRWRFKRQTEETDSYEFYSLKEGNWSLNKNKSNSIASGAINQLNSSLSDIKHLENATYVMESKTYDSSSPSSNSNINSVFNRKSGLLDNVIILLIVLGICAIIYT